MPREGWLVFRWDFCKLLSIKPIWLVGPSCLCLWGDLVAWVTSLLLSGYNRCIAWARPLRHWPVIVGTFGGGGGMIKWNTPYPSKCMDGREVFKQNAICSSQKLEFVVLPWILVLLVDPSRCWNKCRSDRVIIKAYSDAYYVRKTWTWFKMWLSDG